MSEEQEIVSVKVNQKSVFKVKDFYSFVFELVNSQGFDIFEKVFKKDGNDTVFEWDCYNWVDDYVKLKIWLKCSIRGAERVKVKRQGIAESMEKASVEIKIKGKIITDWNDRWEANPLVKFLKGLYDKYLFKPSFEQYKKTVTDNVYLIENEIKSFFELPRFM